MDTEQDHETKVLTALRRAVANALERKRRLGQYAVVWRDGRPVRIEGEELARAVGYQVEATALTTSVREPGPGGDDREESRK